jgi:hypothetical protein
VIRFYFSSMSELGWEHLRPGSNDSWFRVFIGPDDPCDVRRIRPDATYRQAASADAISFTRSFLVGSWDAEIVAWSTGRNGPRSPRLFLTILLRNVLL